MKTRQSMLMRARDPGSDAWFRLYEIYHPLIENWLGRFGIAGSDACDLSQEVLLVVSQELPEFRHNGRTGAFRAWLKSITLLRCRRYWYSRRKSVPFAQGVEVDQLLNQVADPNSDLSRQWDHEHDQHVLTKMLQLVKQEFDTRTFVAFYRSVIGGEPAKEIAQDLKISTGQVYKYKFRVMRRMTQDGRELIELPEPPWKHSSGTIDSSFAPLPGK